MRNFAAGLKIVVLESPYDTWTDQRVGNLYRDLVGLKLRGYGREYQYGVLPVDVADLISTHLAVVRCETNNDFKPVMAIRWTSLKKVRRHYMNFPGLSLLQQANASDHIAALDEVIRSVDSSGTDLYYCGGLSIDPRERGDKTRSAFYRELLTMMYVNYQRQNPSTLMAGGTLRFKIDDYMRWLGHLPLQDRKDGAELGPIQVQHLAGEPVHAMILKDFSSAAIRSAEKWDSLWQDRLWIHSETSTNISEQSPKKAA